MGNFRRGTIITGLALATVLFSGCAERTPTRGEPEVLSASRAGGVYLSAVCPVNDAWDEVDLELDRLRLAIGRGDDETAALAKALAELAARSDDAASELAPEEHSWPASAESPIAEVRETLLADATQALRVAKLPAHTVVSYVWEGGGDIGATGAAARTALNLPADAVAACAQWRKQQADRGESSNSNVQEERGTKNL